jgi:hypothetical protein
MAVKLSPSPRCGKRQRPAPDYYAVEVDIRNTAWRLRAGRSNDSFKATILDE